MRKGLVLLVITVFSWFCWCWPNGLAAADQGLAPLTNQGKKWRIAYCGMRTSVNYDANLNAIVRGLTALGWLTNTEDFPYVAGQAKSAQLWQWLADRDTGPYIEFVADAYYFADGTDVAVAEATAQRLIDRLGERQDIDVIFVMGTYAGQLLANDHHATPTLVFSTSDAVGAHIVASAYDSGKDHVWAHMFPARFKRQVEVFHDLFGFRRMGMIYDDSPNGRSMAAVDDVEAVARERGFVIIPRFVSERQPGQAAYQQALLSAHQSLAEEVDAVYLTVSARRPFALLPEFLEPFYAKQIPVFSQQGVEVQHGSLISVNYSDFYGFGLFAGETIARVLTGARPRSLVQVYETAPMIVLNMDTAQRIGYRPPFEVLLSADAVFRAADQP